MIESAAEFVGLRTREDPGEYQRAAREEAPLEVWLAVIEDYPDMRQWVAHNKTVPAVVLEALAGDSDPLVRWVVATRRSAPAHVLDRLAHDKDETVRARVARNARVPLDIVRRLADDESPFVRTAAHEAMVARGVSSDQGAPPPPAE